MTPTTRVPAPDAPPPPKGWPGPNGALRPPAPGASGLRAPGVGLAVGAIGAYLGAQLAVGLVAGAVLVALGAVPGDPVGFDGSALLAAAVAGQVVGLAAAVALVRVRGVRLADVMGPMRPVVGRALAGLGLGAVTLVASSLLVALLVGISGSEAMPQQMAVDEFLAGGIRTLLAVLAAVVLAPVAEELLFRGLLYRSLRVGRGVAAAALLSAVPFAVVHLEVVLSQPLALIGLVLVGVVLAVAAERTGGLLVPIALHAGYNATALVAALVVERTGLIDQLALLARAA